MKYNDKKPLVFASNLETLDNLYNLKKVGAGHDGIVYQYGDKAIKELKYNLEERKSKDLMTFEKACYFAEWAQKFKKILLPTDVLLTIDGIFAAYVMEYINNMGFENFPFNNLSIQTFLENINDLYEDFLVLNQMHTVAMDINNGSYMFDKDFLHICDVDKYIIYNDSRSTEVANRKAYNYLISKLIYLLMYDKSLGKDINKKLNLYVRQCSQMPNYLDKLNKELSPVSTEPLLEYTNSLKKKLIK